MTSHKMSYLDDVVVRLDLLAQSIELLGDWLQLFGRVRQRCQIGLAQIATILQQTNKPVGVP